MADRPPFFLAAATRTTKRSVCKKPRGRFPPDVIQRKTRTSRSHLFWAICSARDDTSKQEPPVLGYLLRPHKVQII